MKIEKVLIGEKWNDYRFNYYESGHTCGIKPTIKNYERRLKCDCRVVYYRKAKLWYLLQDKTLYRLSFEFTRFKHYYSNNFFIKNTRYFLHRRYTYLRNLEKRNLFIRFIENVLLFIIK